MNIELEMKDADGNWVEVEFPVVNNVCHLPAGVFRGRAPGGVLLTGKRSGTVFNCPEFKEPKRKPRPEQPFWAKPW